VHKNLLSLIFVSDVATDVCCFSLLTCLQFLSKTWNFCHILNIHKKLCGTWAL